MSTYIAQFIMGEPFRITIINIELRWTKEATQT